MLTNSIQTVYSLIHGGKTEGFLYESWGMISDSHPLGAYFILKAADIIRRSYTRTFKGII